jgi:hypothetical protein
MTRVMSRRRLAAVLWVVWAVVVWNVVFDHTIEVAGRAYLHAAAVAAQSGGPYLRIDDWMRPAATRGLLTATAIAAAILVTGFGMLRFASLRARRETGGMAQRDCR